MRKLILATFLALSLALLSAPAMAADPVKTLSGDITPGPGPENFGRRPEKRPRRSRCP